jgi:hypothetical protein
MEWIRVSERDSPPMEPVLLCIAGRYVITGWNHGGWNYTDPGLASYDSYEDWPEGYLTGHGVTHWMPLPDPPKE